MGAMEKVENFRRLLIYPEEQIDSFTAMVEDGGGDIPWLIKIALPAILLGWLIYLIVFWIV
jgi:hypothetical protein